MFPIVPAVLSVPRSSASEVVRVPLRVLVMILLIPVAMVEVSLLAPLLKALASPLIVPVIPLFRRLVSLFMADPVRLIRLLVPPPILLKAFINSLPGPTIGTLGQG